MKTFIRLMINIFGKSFWKNVVLEATFWRHDIVSLTVREHSIPPLTESHWQDEHNKHLKKFFNIYVDIPVVFIDPTFLKTQENEVITFKDNAYKLLHQSIKNSPFKFKVI